MNERSLSERRVIVTGGSSGIGLATARGLAERGASVVICSRDKAEIVAVAERIDDPGDGRVVGVQCDVTDADDVSALVEACVSKFGGVDGLVNNVGDSIGDGMIHEIDESTWDRNIETNLKGTFLCSREVVPYLAESDGGSMVHVSAVNGLTGIGYIAYSTAKCGIEEFSRLLATQYGCHGIRSNVVAPGTVVTESRQKRRSEVAESAKNQLLDQYPVGRFGTPDEVADTIAFLLSERASFVSGTTIKVDGGLMAGLDHEFEQSYYGIEDTPSREWMK